MAVINGNRFTIIVSDSSSDTKLSFAHTQSASVSFSNSLVEATLGPSDGWAEFISGKKNTNINFDGLYDYGTIVGKYNSEELGDFLLDESLIYFQIGDGNAHFYGEGHISEISQSGSTDDVATYSGVLTVNGRLRLLANVEDVDVLLDSDGDPLIDDSGQEITAIRIT